MTFAYTVLAQGATNGNYRGRRGGGAGDFDMIGRWQLLNPEKKTGWLTEGSLGFNLEYRHKIGGTAPSALGDSIGSLWPTTSGFNDQQFSLIQLWWQQFLFDNRVVLRVGKLDLSSIFDAYRYNSANFFYMNNAFASNPALPFPQNGLGVAAGWNITDEWFVIVGSGDANGRKTETARTFFNKIEEWFTATTFGWDGDVGDLGNGLYQVTVWHTNSRKNSQRPSATGYSIVLQQELPGRWVPFARYAYLSDAAADVKHLLTAGAVLEGVGNRDEDRLG